VSGKNSKYLNSWNMKNLGIILVVIGMIMMVWTGFNYVTRERIVDVGPVHVTAKKNNPVQWSPILGGVILAAGIVVIVANKRK
jgi:Na+/melibiose symporter-like transporter